MNSNICKKIIRVAAIIAAIGAIYIGQESSWTEAISGIVSVASGWFILEMTCKMLEYFEIIIHNQNELSKQIKDGNLGNKTAMKTYK